MLKVLVTDVLCFVCWDINYVEEWLCHVNKGQRNNMQQQKVSDAGIEPATSRV